MLTILGIIFIGLLAIPFPRTVLVCVVLWPFLNLFVIIPAVIAFIIDCAFVDSRF